MPDAILRLALPSPLRRLFDYRAPAGVLRAQLQPGMRLRVPFGRREMIGILVEVTDTSEVPVEKLKPALALLDTTPPLPPALFKLCLWTSPVLSAQPWRHSELGVAGAAAPGRTGRSADRSASGRSPPAPASMIRVSHAPRASVRHWPPWPNTRTALPISC